MPSGKGELGNFGGKFVARDNAQQYRDLHGRQGNELEKVTKDPENGMASVATATMIVLNSRSLSGRLQKDGRCVRRISTTIRSASSDTINHPVWNTRSFASNTLSRNAKVKRSKSALTGPSLYKSGGYSPGRNW